MAKLDLKTKILFGNGKINFKMYGISQGRTTMLLNRTNLIRSFYKEGFSNWYIVNVTLSLFSNYLS